MKYRTSIPLAVAALAVAIGGPVVAGLATAPAAQATANSYLNDIYSSHYNFTGPPSAYMNVGNGVCRFHRSGDSQGDIIDWVINNTGPGIYWDQAKFITESAEIFLC
jgi:hypothetical protein